MEIIPILGAVLALIGIVWFAGQVIDQAINNDVNTIFYGKWAPGYQHRCGYLTRYSHEKDVCPQCGETDDQWQDAVYRWHNRQWEVK